MLYVGLPSFRMKSVVTEMKTDILIHKMLTFMFKQLVENNIFLTRIFQIFKQVSPGYKVGVLAGPLNLSTAITIG